MGTEHQLFLDFEAVDTPEDLGPPTQPSATEWGHRYSRHLNRLFKNPLDWILELYQRKLKEFDHDHERTMQWMVENGYFLRNPEYDPSDPSSRQFLPNDKKQPWAKKRRRK
ncbi:MAG: hypothetical protein WCX61_05475 [Candidatus Peribacteraceae bacterium]